MRVCGVVAEYNPFHSGHAGHLAEARKRSGADAVAVVMSGCFTQRGEAACLSPAVRAEMALAGGADLALLLPAAWAVREAERFAEAGMLVLSALGCDAVSCGTETADPSLITACARLLEEAPDAFRSEVRTGLDAGLPQPEALTEAAEALLPGAGPLLRQPNSLLAVHYLRAMLRHRLHMDFLPAPRSADHRDTQIRGRTASASALRSALERGDWLRIAPAMPEASFALLRREALEGRLHRPAALDQALAARLRLMTEAEWAALPGCSEGIERRLRKASRHAVTREALLEAAATRRYPRARFSRLCCHALLGLTQADLDGLPVMPPLILLGLKDSGKPVLARLKERGVPLAGRAALDRSLPWVRAEERAWDLWALGVGAPCGGFYRQKLVRV